MPTARAHRHVPLGRHRLLLDLRAAAHLLLLLCPIPFHRPRRTPHKPILVPCNLRLLRGPLGDSFCSLHLLLLLGHYLQLQPHLIPLAGTGPNAGRLLIHLHGIPRAAKRKTEGKQARIQPPPKERHTWRTEKGDKKKKFPRPWELGLERCC